MRDEPNAFQVGYIGDVARLEVPLRSVMNLRRIADELRGLAMRLDCLSRYPDPNPGVTMLAARFEVKRTSDRMAAIRSRGRPKRSRHKF